jgi:hypothetical protein
MEKLKMHRNLRSAQLEDGFRYRPVYYLQKLGFYSFLRFSRKIKQRCKIHDDMLLNKAV